MQNPQYDGPFESHERSSTGLEPNIVALLCYILAPLTGIVFYVVEKESRFVRYHAMQSILFGVAAIVISVAYNVLSIIVSSFSWVIGMLFGLGGLFLALLFVAAWIYCLLKAYQGQKFKLPIIGAMAEQWTR
jgi:uncharacterized membrane protein